MSYRRHRPYVAGGATIVGRLRVIDRHFVNDAGPFAFLGVADLAAIGDVLHGRADQVWARFDDYARARRTVVRVLGMLGETPWVAAGLDFGPTTPGYAAARQQVVDEANRRGLYVKFDLFADAQIVVPDADARTTLTREFAAFCRGNDGVLPGLSNEPFKNGWASAVDPALLDLGEVFAQAVGHRDFAIGDPVDDANMPSQLRLLSTRSNVIETHPDRSYVRTDDASDPRFRRWVDHLEGVTEIDGLAPGAAYVVGESTGAGPFEIPGRRDNDPDALAAGPFVSACCGFAGYVYHYIVGEIATADLPGFYAPADVLARIPATPDWRYYNDSWPGAPTEGIAWTGKEGKIRHLVRGAQAWSIAYGDADFETAVRWRAGWVPRVEYAGRRIRVWSVNQ